jgi:hypothetical protein
MRLAHHADFGAECAEFAHETLRPANTGARRVEDSREARSKTISEREESRLKS